MHEKQFDILGMSCGSCQKKISDKLNSLPDISAVVDLKTNSVKISSKNEINLQQLNDAVGSIGHYFLKDPDNHDYTFIKPEDKISPSSVYFCPMECEGEKLYFKQGKCPVCGMYLAPIEEREEIREKAKSTENQKVNLDKIGEFYCPMFCEGDKTYPKNTGCPVCGMDLVQIVAEGQEDNSTYIDLRKKFYIALAFTTPVFILAMGGMMGLPIDKIPHHTQLYLQAAFTIPVVYAGFMFFQRAYVSFKTWNLNMFSLIGLGAGSALVLSCITLFFPNIFPNHAHPPIYFESVCMIITLVLLGQLLEAKAHQKTGNAIRKLMNLSPSEAHLWENGEEKTVKIDEIKADNILRVKPGEKIPVDGVIIEGYSTIDESMITGEPIPVEKSIDNQVISGTINGNGTFLMKSQRVGSETLLAQIIKMVNDASRSKAPIQKLTDKVSKVFVPVVVFISVLTFVLWWIFGAEPKFFNAFVNALAVLVIACPCALGLATPMSVVVGIGKGAQNGILIKSAEALEQMEKINVLITDKTGTLTEGKPSLEYVFPAKNYTEDQIINISASLNKNSEHPLSKAILSKSDASQIEVVSDFQNLVGKGIEGIIGGKKYFLGNEKYITENAFHVADEIKEKISSLSNKAFTISYLIENNAVIGFLCFTDKLKPTAKKAVEFLQSKNIEVIMLTGDNEATAHAVANELGIKNYQANCLPEDKINKIKELQKQGKIVAMTGDGINDAPALAQADIGIAMGTGTDVAIDSAEISLLKGDIYGIVKAKILSEKMMRNIKENLFFAFIYNTLGIPVAAGLLYPIFGILLSPMLAAAAMSFSSVSVIINSLRLNNIILNEK
jgi:copper-exporting ATPase